VKTETVERSATLKPAPGETVGSARIDHLIWITEKTDAFSDAIVRSVKREECEIQADKPWNPAMRMACRAGFRNRRGGKW